MLTASLPPLLRDSWHLLRSRDSLRAETRSCLSKEGQHKEEEIEEIRFLFAVVALGARN
jgi:hypothetical protein